VWEAGGGKMAAESPGVDVVVCHYNKSGALHVRWMALHATAFLMKDRPQDLHVVVCDGSPERDESLARALSDLGAQYFHSGRDLSFAETYNAGIRRTSRPIVVTMANDVLVEASQVRALIADVRGNVGCVLPYLTVSDYGAQRARRFPVPRRCLPSRMTLNVNAFAREALERVGLIPEQMTGCFNDVILFIRLREAGYSVILRNVGRVIHLGRQTLKTGATNVRYADDARLFAGRCPLYWRNGVILFHKVAQRRLTRAMYGFLEQLPARWVERFRLWDRAWALEPYLCAEKGTCREALGRIFKRAGGWA